MRAPALFVGHGSPMNAIERNKYTETWREWGQLFRPKAILSISAHWFTRNTWVQSEPTPKKINDMYGFPEELYALAYDVSGDPELTQAVRNALGDQVAIDNNWGIDHGTWSVLVHMYPEADIPVVQLSVDGIKSPEEKYRLGQQLSHLRDQGVMILGSGNIVHNLRNMQPTMKDMGYDWADDFDSAIREAIQAGDHQSCVHYEQLKGAKMAVPTTDHYDPLLYVLGAIKPSDNRTVANDERMMGSLSMTSYLFR